MPSATPKFKRIELKPSPLASLQKALGVRATSNMWIDPITEKLSNRPAFLKLNREPDTGTAPNRADNGPWACFIPANKVSVVSTFGFTYVQSRSFANPPVTGNQRIGKLNIGPFQSGAFGLQLSVNNTNVIALTPAGRNMHAQSDLAFMVPEPTYTNVGSEAVFRGSNTEIGAIDGSSAYTVRQAASVLGVDPTSFFDAALPRRGSMLNTLYAAGRTGILYGGLVEGSGGPDTGAIAWTSTAVWPSAGGGYVQAISGSGVGASIGIVNGAIVYREKYVITWTDRSITAWEVRANDMVPVSSSTAAGSKFNFSAVTVGTSVIMLTDKGLVNLSQEVFKDSLVPAPFLPEYNEVVLSFLQNIYKATALKITAVAEPLYSFTMSNALVSYYSTELNSIFFVSPLTNQCLYVYLGSATSSPFVGMWEFNFGAGNFIRGIYGIPYGYNTTTREVAIVIHTYDRGVTAEPGTGMRNQIWVLGDWFTENAIRQGITTATGAGSITNRNDKVAQTEVLTSSVDYVFGDALVEDNSTFTGVELKNLEFGVSWWYNYPAQSEVPSITLDVFQNKTSGAVALDYDSFPVPQAEVLETRRDGFADPYTTAQVKDTRTIRLPFLRSGGSEVIVRMNINSGYSVYLDSVYPTFRYRKREQSVKDSV